MPRKKPEYIVVPDYFGTDEEIDAYRQDNIFQRDSVLQAQQKTVDSEYMSLVEWQDKPDQMIRQVFGFQPWTCTTADDQLDVIYAVRDHPKVSVRSGNGVGKTAVAARIVLAFLYSHYPGLVITTAPTVRQVEKLLWGEIRLTHKNSLINLGGELLTTEIRLDDNWYAIGFSTDEPDKFQGFHSPHILIVVDEAGGVSETIFEAIEGVMTSANARILLIGNPTDPSSYFGRSHLHPRESRSWFKMHLSCYNSPNVIAGKNVIPSLVAYDWPAKKLYEWGEYNPFYQVRVIGNFPESGADSLVPYHMVHSSLDRIIKPRGKKVFGVDVARFGGDKSIIGCLWGSQYRILQKLHNQDGPKLANNIVKELIAEKDKTDKQIEEVKIDVIGFGSSCYDALRGKKRSGTDKEIDILKNVKIIPVNVAEKTRDKKARKDYYNIRAEAGFAVRKMFEEEDIDIEDEDLAMQAANLKYEFRDGRYILEDKDKFKKRFRESPDELDSLMIAKATTRGGSPAIH